MLKQGQTNPNIINYTYDPSRIKTPTYKQPNLVSYSPPNNTSLKQSGNEKHHSITNQSNYPIYSNNLDVENKTRKMVKMLDTISNKIYNHFRVKYPAFIDASGFNLLTIQKIVEQISSRTSAGYPDEKSISKIINIIDHKFKTTSHSENRTGKQFDTTTFSMDTESKISMDKYLENYSNKIDILLDTSNHAIEADLPKSMSPVNDMKLITPIEPFNEDFPSRDREKQTDMLVPELREYDYYITIDSKDRDPIKYPEPNNFVIEFAPAPPGAGETRKGYIDRGLGNVKSCELMNVIVRDVSDQPDSSLSGSASYPYLLLQFEELQANYYGTNNNITRSFAILGDYILVGKYRYYKLIGDRAENTVSRVYNPRINLNKITTQLLLPNGNPFNFGSAFSNDTSNTCITMSFRFTTIQKNLATQFINKATY